MQEEIQKATLKAKESPLVNQRDAAKYLGITVPTMLKWLKQDKVPHVAYRGKWRIRQAYLDIYKAKLEEYNAS